MNLKYYELLFIMMSLAQTHETTKTGYITKEEKNSIITKFPEHLREYLINLENPLDEVQVLITVIPG